MYELVILGFLMRSVTHAYRISKIINDMIGPYAKFSSGRLYPLIEKLEQEGFIESAASDGANSTQRHRAYQITDAGRVRFIRLMLDTATNLGDYRRLFGFKFVFFDLLEPEERVYLAEHFIHYCQTHVYHLDREIEDLKLRAPNIPGDVTMALRMMEHQKAIWELEMDWVMHIRKELP